MNLRNNSLAVSGYRNLLIKYVDGMENSLFFFLFIQELKIYDGSGDIENVY